MKITKEDLKNLKTEIVEALDQRMDDKFRINNDILRQEIRASEHRIKTELRQEIQQSKQEVIQSVAEILDTNVLPSLDSHEQRLTKLEAKTV
jgi:hypothetical protein